MLSIIITHHRAPVLLKLCLKSITENIGDLKREIIVVDSQSEEETRDIIEEKFPGAKIIPFSKNLGYAKIVNKGIEASRGEYLLILNADIIVDKEAIPEMLKYMEEHQRAGIVGPRLLGFNNVVQNSCFRFPDWGTIIARRTFVGKLDWGKRKIENFLNKADANGLPQKVDWLQGSAMLARRTAVESVGPLDERFFMYFEDTDWCRRFWQNNWEVIYLPTSRMYHYYYRVSKKMGGLLDIFFNKYTRLHLISAAKYFWKYRKD